MKSNIITNSTVSAMIGLLLLLSLVPVTAGAQRGDGPKFCENIDTNKDTALSRLEEKKAKTDRSDQYETKKSERLDKLETARAEADEKRAAKYDQLRDRATTDEQEAAVDDFIETSESLVDTRRAAIDQSIADFEEAVEALMEERSDAIGSAAADIESDIEDIFDEAEEACDDGDSDAEVRAAFIEDMKALRDEKKADREKYSFREDLQELRETRRAAGEVAWEAFREDIAEAKAELKAAFGSE